MADDKKFKPSTAVHTPTQTATYGINAVKRAKESVDLGLGIGIPIAGIRDYVPPVMPGQIMAIIGQTSNYKSGFMHMIEHEAAMRLSELDRKRDIIIHVSVEEVVEEQAFLELSRESGEDAGDLARGIVQDWSKLEAASIKVGQIPIFRIGESLARADDMPLLYISNIARAIDELVNGNILDWKPNVAGIFFDYLQAFPIDPEFRSAQKDQQRRLQVRSDIYRLRQCAAKYRCPVFVAVQAKQHLNGARPPIMLPGQYDGEESAAIGQRSDRVITVWMPKQTHVVGEYIDYKDISFQVQENQIWVKVAKQRGRLPAGRVWPCIVDFDKNIIAPEATDYDRSISPEDYRRWDE